MNVVYSSSDLFAEIVAVSIVSLLENCLGERIHIYIINNGIKLENQKKLRTLVEKYDQKLEFLALPDIEKIVGRKISVGRWNISTFGRCFLCSIMPLSIDKMLFIDADTIVRHSLVDIYNMDMGNKAVLGVDDCRGGAYRKNVGLPYAHEYINCGFMLINLKLWRKINVEQQCIDFINDHNGGITYMDQGVLNGVLGKADLIGLISPRYNAQRLYFDFSYNDFIKIRRPAYHYAENEYEEAIKDPIVVHFTTCFITGTRPWNDNDTHPYKNEYLRYKELTPWANAPLWADDRKKGKKIMSFVCQHMPGALMITGISFVHAVLYPMVRNIKMKKRNRRK